MDNKVRPTALLILDGYGIGAQNAGNAIWAAKTPVMDKLLACCPHTQLSASGLDVGLPEGQMGNSEVGHTNIGAGRVVYQDLPRITNAVNDGSFFENPAYVKAMDDAALDLPIAYPPEHLEGTIGEYVSNLGIKQFRVAETEKYAHVTFFLNGGVEKQYEGEERVLVPSPKEFPTYDLIPQMSAVEVKDKLVARMDEGGCGLYVCNFANCDMVGHTGVTEAAITAVETVDKCLGEVVECAKRNGIALAVTADHGNADRMVEPDGSPNTAHTTNPVPFIIVGTEDMKLREGGRLADIAPTLLELMGLPAPKELTGVSLIEK